MPSYRLPVDLVFSIGFTLLSRRGDHLVSIATRWYRACRPEPIAEGLEHIPRSGPLVVVANHYERSGLWVGFSAAVITAVLARARGQTSAFHWLINEETEGFRFAGVPVPRWLVWWTVSRGVAAYGLIPVPFDESRKQERAAALRAALGLFRQRSSASPPDGHRTQVLALFPEAQTSSQLVEARAGSGVFLALLSELGVPILPVGVSEQGGRLHLTFGRPLALSIPAEAERAQRDRLAKDSVMVAIGRLLPPELWGFYRSQIEAGLRVPRTTPEGSPPI